MPIPSEITALIERLNSELNQIEQEATEGLNLARASLERFPDNAALIQMFAFLNTSIFLVDTQRRRIQTIIENISVTDVTRVEQIQEAGEELETELGRVLETKIVVSRIKTRLENLQ